MHVDCRLRLREPSVTTMAVLSWICPPGEMKDGQSDAVVFDVEVEVCRVDVLYISGNPCH